ncbi:O-antigen ligase family protein [Marinobacter sediminum]|uniref:O-antigen ligase family protein n=1 Tax=Marinobacter sediminum TaxID=256323 RepID=UPI00193A1A33|nr:O-antigen ligase family protein [Marinobacter sediminum]
MKALIFALVVIPPLLLFHFQPVPSFTMEFAAFFILTILFVVVAICYSQSIAFPKFGAIWVFLGVVWLGVGAAHSEVMPVNDRWAFVFWLIGFLSLVVFGSLVRLMGREKAVSIFAYSLVVMAFFQCLIGFFEHYGILGKYIPWMNYSSGRFSGTVAQPNAAAFSIFLGIVSLFYLFLIRKASWLIVIVILFIFSYFSYLTYSRSFYVYLSVFMVFIFVVFASSKLGAADKARITSPVLAIFILVPVAAIGLGSSIDSGTRYLFSTIGIESVESDSSQRVKDFSGSVRLCEWSKALEHMGGGSFSLLGYGHGSYSKFSAANTTDATIGCSRNLLWNHSHNLLINALVEWGWLGLATVLGMAVFCLLNAFRVTSGEIRYFYLLNFSAFLIYSFLEFPLWNIYFLIVFIFLVSVGSHSWKISFSKALIPKAIGLAFMVVLLVGFTNSLNVYLRVSSVFNSGVASEGDLRWLYLYGADDLWGDRVILTRYYKFMPEPYQYSQQLQEVDAILSLQRHPVALVRKGLLHFLSGEELQYCRTERLLERQYPKYLGQLERELILVAGSSVFDVKGSFSCN